MTSPFSFVTKIESSDPITPTLPISPVLDKTNGSYVVGKDGITYHLGGAHRNNSIIGGNNTQKTGLLTLAVARILWRFAESVAFFFDVEATYDVERLARCYDRECGIPGEFNKNVLNKRYFYFNRNDGYDGNKIMEFYKSTVASVKEELKNNKNAYMKSPFLDANGKQIEMVVPILFCVDSISEMHFEKVSAEFQEGDVDEGGKKKTRDMVIGNMRRILYEDADILGGSIGATQFWTAQLVDTINMTGRPEEKESVFLRQGKKIKGPKSLMRIPSWGIEVIRGMQLKSGQEWMYPNPFGRDIVITKDSKDNPDLMLYPLSTYRNKNGSSGGNYFFIGSQSLGVQEGLTMFHALKDNGFFGLEGSVQRQTCVLYPELTVQRTTIWEKVTTDDKFFRALTICYDMLHMQTFNLNLENKYRITPTELYSLIIERGLDWGDILSNTVDYWFNNPAIQKHTVSTMELLKIALGEREAYWIKKDKKDKSEGSKT